MFSFIKSLSSALISFIRLLLFCILIISCHQNKKDNVQQINEPDKYKKPLENANKYMVKSEDLDIENFIKRHNWKMKRTGTGLRYMIYKNGDGIRAKIGEKVKLEYELRLISGNIIYSSKQNGIKEFILGKSNAESGLEEGITFLKVGDKAKFILPSHLAYGLHGDENKIPKRATLIYDVELIAIDN